MDISGVESGLNKGDHSPKGRVVAVKGFIGRIHQAGIEAEGDKGVFVPFAIEESPARDNGQDACEGGVLSWGGPDLVKAVCTEFPGFRIRGKCLDQGAADFFDRTLPSSS